MGRPTSRRVCDIPGCGRRHLSRGWCANHYALWARNGSPVAQAERRPLAERFWSHVDATAGDGGCWPWVGTLSPQGYGHFKINGKATTAHRVACELARGAPIPAGQVIDHLCRNPQCVNPRHLEPVTPSVNVLRGARSNPHLRIEDYEGD